MNTILFKQKIKKRRRTKNNKYFVRQNDFFISLVQNILNYLNKNKLIPIGALLIIALSILVFNIVVDKGIPDTPQTYAQISESLITIEDRENIYKNLKVGSGILSFDRDEDVEYLIKDGDTLSEIAYLYGIKLSELALYNDIRNYAYIKEGQEIIIPSKNTMNKFLESQKNIMPVSIQEKEPASYENPLPKSVTISAIKKRDGETINALFSIDTEINEEAGINYIWDLGNGKKSFRKSFTYSYTVPGTYPVTLTLQDRYGNQVRSNTLYLEIPDTSAIKSTRQVFLTLNNITDTFYVNGEISQIEDFLGNTVNPIEFIKAEDGKNYYKANNAGFLSLIAKNENQESNTQIYLFVSPIESIHNDRTDINWYQTQFNSGTPSNCGPAVVAMGIGWAKGQYISVAAVRNQIGWIGDGGTSFYDLIHGFNVNGVNSFITEISSPEDIFNIIDKQHIAIILYHCGMISWTKNKPQFDLFGRYYNDSVGHYVIIKGYSADKKYFIIYDPLPSDWVSNSKRYGDGISMIGRNRYYPVEEVFRALSIRSVIEITRD